MNIEIKFLSFTQGNKDIESDACSTGHLLTSSEPVSRHVVHIPSAGPAQSVLGRRQVQTCIWFWAGSDMHRLMCERMLLCPGLCKMGLEIVQSGHLLYFV